MLHQSGLISLGESSAVKASRERREHIEALCLTAIPLMQAHRFELEAIFRKNFAERHQLIASAFDSMDNALTAWDADQFNCGLEKINTAFGASLPFKSFDEFNEFMLDDSRDFVL